MRWLLLAALALLPLALFSQSLGFGFINLDDAIYFDNNPLLHNGDLPGLRDLWTRPYFDDYAPITQLTIWVDLALSRHGSLLLTRLHHLIWMGLCALAVFQLIRRITGREQLAWAVALLYAVHPACAESALWIAERKNLVSIALSLWAIERHIAWRQGAGAGALVASLLLCPLALLAKAHAVIIPAVIACYEALLGAGTLRRRLLALAPTGVMAICFVAICMQAVHLYHSSSKDMIAGSVAGMLLCDGAIVLRYLCHAALPFHLVLFYHVIEDPRSWPSLLGCWLLVLAVIAASIAVASQRRLIVFAWCAAACSILPAINLKPLPLPMSDHYLQWSLPWLLLILALLALDALRSARQLDWQRLARWSLGGYASLLAAMSFARLDEFSSALGIARTGIIYQGDCAINWGLYCSAEWHATPPNMAEAGRAGLIALNCDDYRRMFYAQMSESTILGAIECKREHGQEATATLLAKALPLMNKQVQAYVVGTIAFLEGRFQDAVTALTGLYLPPVQAAARAVASQCRSDVHLPWDFPPAVDPEDAQVRDPQAVNRRNGFSFQALCLLSASWCRIGDYDEAFDLAALLVNISPQDDNALRAYCDACARLGLRRSAQVIGQRIAANAAASDTTVSQASSP